MRAFDSKWGIPHEGDAEATEVKTRYRSEVAVAAEIKLRPCSSSTGAPFSGGTVTVARYERKGSAKDLSSTQPGEERGGLTEESGIFADECIFERSDVVEAALDEVDSLLLKLLGGRGSDIARQARDRGSWVPSGQERVQCRPSLLPSRADEEDLGRFARHGR